MIDIVIVDHGPEAQGGDPFRRPLSPSVVARIVNQTGLLVRSVTVLDAATGLTGTYRDSETGCWSDCGGTDD